MSRTSPESTEATAARYAAAGFTGRARLGQVPALVVVGLCRGFTDPGSPLGPALPDVVRRTAELVRKARRSQVLVVYTTIAISQVALATSAWVRKVPSLRVLSEGSPWTELDPDLGRLDSEPVIAKVGASAFFGTSLRSLLAAHHVDTVLVAGATTSGCVRATVVDAVQEGYDTFVLVDCVADRAQSPHESSLFDMTSKYADPFTGEEAAGYFSRNEVPPPVLPAG
jgi:maleamate amidohydrolase